jgi:RNA polymerase sigma-70 factor (ECF subfamily)
MIGLMAEPLLAENSAREEIRPEQVRHVSTGDFGRWMTSEQRRIFALCQRFLQDREEADSATQDVFLKAYQALSRSGAEDLTDPSRWVTRIAVNTCLDRLRSRKWQFWRRRPSPEDERTILTVAPSRDPGAEDAYFAHQIGTRLQAALSKLSPRQHAVFTLRHFEDMSLEEISGILSLDIGTVKAHMFRAIAKLRIELRDLYGGVK